MPVVHIRTRIVIRVSVAASSTVHSFKVKLLFQIAKLYQCKVTFSKQPLTEGHIEEGPTVT
jgi:hypothetical protein